MDMLTPHDGITNEKIAKAQIEAVEQKQNEYKLIGQMIQRPGHTLFKFNTSKRTASIADLKTEKKIQYDPQTSTVTYVNRSSVNVEKDCYYEQALNMKSFIKRLRRRGIIHQEETIIIEA